MYEKSNNRLKVAWICHFSNQHVRNRLGIKKGMDFAPWITLSIEEIEKRDDIELHVVAPHNGLSKSQYLERNGIHYHFIKTGIPFIKRNWPRYFKLDYWLKYIPYSREIEKTVKKIDPEIINLHGAENPHYSSSILRLLDYPILVNIQGIFALMIKDKKQITKYEKYRANIENTIYKKCENFGIRVNFMGDYIKSLNSNAKFYWQIYPIKNQIHIDYKNTTKKYDIVYFARIVKEKGIEDLLEALKIIKEKKKDVSLLIIGDGSSTYIDYLKQKIHFLGIENNVVYKGALPTQENVHNEAVRARISALPTYFDTIPGTIIESMFLGLPVVSYPVGGIPSLNQGRESITLAEKKNIVDLAQKIIGLLKDEKEAEEKANNGLKTAKECFDNQKQISKLISYYIEILSD